jgi:tetratricopeptide (TPR) repeat protein
MSSTIAIVFGVSKDLGGHFHALPAAQIDAIHFARALSHWGVPEIALFLNEQATLENLHRWLSSRKTSYEKLIFYFCGHGQREIEKEAIPSSDLVFYDGLLKLDSLIHKICQVGAEENYIFIDACSLRINTIVNPKLAEELKGQKHSHKSLFCLLSSGIQQSYENSRYGYFTNALLKSLAQLRKKEPDPTELFRTICAFLEKEGLPFPEMYNIGNQKISFLTPLAPRLEKNGWMRRSEMIAKIEDALILNQGKVGVLRGDRGIGKTALCHSLVSDIYKISYVKTLPSPSLNSLVLIDDAEKLQPQQICRFLEGAIEQQTQYLFISDDSFSHIPSPWRSYLFEIEMDTLSLEEGKQLMQTFKGDENERRFIHLVSRGNPSKIKQITHHLDRNILQTDRIEKEQLFKVMSALYGCGCYLDQELFAKVFDLPEASLTLLQECGLLIYDNTVYSPHPVFYEIAEAESDSLHIQPEKVLEYWYRQIKRTSNSTQAAENLIYSLKCFGYEKKAEPYLKIAFKTLSHRGQESLPLLIEGAHIFLPLAEMTESSALLAEIFTDLQEPQWAAKLRQAKPLKGKKRKLAFIGLLLPLLYFFPIHHEPPSVLNLKQTHPDFVGRKEYMKQLRNLCLKWESSPSMAVLWGEAGIGKSEIATAFANSHAKHFKLISWINCETEESYAASYYALAKLLQIPIDQEKDLVQKVHQYLESSPTLQPWLLILDNAEQKVETPSKGKGSILITTRNRTPWHMSHCLNVVPFAATEALDLFKKITNSTESSQTHSLIKELDFFPLTLNLAAHYIAETPEMDEEQYLKLLSQNNVELISSMPLDTRYPNTLLSSWNIKADELAENDPQILQWLHFASCLSPSGIPSSWIEKWLFDIQKKGDPFQNKIRSGEMLRTLTHQSLMRFEKQTHTLSLHHLRQDVLKKDRHFSSDTLDQVAQFLISCSENIEKIYEKEKTLSDWGILREWEPHAAWFLNHHPSSAEKKSHLQNLLGNWKYIKGDYKLAQSYLEKALQTRLVLYGPEHPNTLISMNNLAIVLWENGQFSESKKLFTTALQALKKLYPEDHLEIVVTLNNLGWVSWEMGQFQEAKALLNQSLVASKKLEACDPDFLQNFNDFIQFLDDNDTSTTDKAVKRALFFRHAGLWIAEVEGNPKKSLSYFEKSLELLKTALPEQDPRIAIAYGSVGISLNRAGRSAEGAEHLSKALALQKLILGDEHPETAKSYANLAISHVNLGNFSQALECHLKALAIRQKALGEDHPITAKSYSGTGVALLGLNKPHEALVYNQKALAIRQKVLGEAHSETAQSYSRLGTNFGKLGEHAKALEYNLQALKILQQNFGENHFLTANVHTALETCYKNLQQFEQAHHHKQKAEEIRKLF